MECGDGGLELIRAHGAPAERGGDERRSFRDLLPVPARPILLRKRNELSLLSRSREAAGSKS